MDPNYAPAWEELGVRAYYDADYSNGGEKMFQRSNKASERALALDPNRIVAAGQLITNRVERGELTKAYVAAQALVKSRLKVDRLISPWLLFSATPECKRKPRVSATPRWSCLRETTSSGRAHGRSWNWARPSARWTLFVWMLVRNGPTPQPSRFCCARENWRRRVRA